MFIAHHKLKNIFWFIDRNNIQGFGRTEDVLQLEPLDEKLKSFGFEVRTIDGHSSKELFHLRDTILASTFTKPLVIIAKTIKGNGIENFQNTVDCHYLPMSKEQYESILTTL